MLKIKSVSEVKTASDGRKYFQVEFGGSLGLQKRKRNIFEDFARDSQGNLLDGKEGRELKTIWKRFTQEEAKEAMKSGELVAAFIITKNVEGYNVPGNPQTLNTYTTVVFEDENVETVFAQANHNIVDEDGVVHERAMLATPKTADVSTEA